MLVLLAGAGGARSVICTDQLGVWHPLNGENSGSWIGINSGIVDGTALCRMLTERFEDRPFRTHSSSDHDRLYRFHQWQANLRIVGVGNQNSPDVSSVCRAAD